MKKLLIFSGITLISGTLGFLACGLDKKTTETPAVVEPEAQPVATAEEETKTLETIFETSIYKKGGEEITILSSENAKNTIWIAPKDTTTFTESATMTKSASGTDTKIITPTTEGTYYVYIVDSGGTIVSTSTATITIDNTPPYFSIDNPVDQTKAPLSTTIYFAIKNNIDNTTLTTNTENTSCSGSFQVSADNFTTCVQMKEPPVFSSDNKKATITPKDPLTHNTEYKVKITTSVTDMAGNQLEKEFNSTFTAIAVIYMFDNGEDIRPNIGSLNNAKTICETRKAADFSNLNCTNIRPFLCSGGKDVVSEMLETYDFNDAPVVTAQNSLLANSWAELLSDRVIPLNEKGVTDGVSIITGCTEPNNSSNTATCNNWTSTASSDSVAQMIPEEANFSKTNTPTSCNKTNYRFLCICQ